MLFGNIGTVTNPLCTISGNCYGDIAGTGGSGGGLPGFIGNALQLLIVVAGLFALFNFVTAGVEYISSQGDPKGIEAAKNKIFMSVVGLTIIAASFALAAILGIVLFGDASIFLSPQLFGPGTL